MKKLIIIRGPAGVGKSTVAGILRTKLEGSLFFSIDYVCNRMLGVSPRIRDSRIKAYEVCFQITKRFAKKGEDVIVERLFSEKEELDRLINLFGKLGYKTKIITLRASLKKVIKQDSKREGRFNLGKERVRDLHSRFTGESLRGNNLIVEVKNKKPETIAKEILNFI